MRRYYFQEKNSYKAKKGVKKTDQHRIINYNRTFAFKMEIFSSKRRRARLCRLPEQEEGEHMEYLHRLLVFALFEDVMLSCCETAGYVRFALFTSGYGYSPPSATLA